MALNSYHRLAQSSEWQAHALEQRVMPAQVSNSSGYLLFQTVAEVTMRCHGICPCFAAEG